MSAQTRVLVVDDESSLRDALARYLTRRGFEIATASSGLEALGRLREGGVDLMLLDIRQRSSADPSAQGQEDDTPANQFHLGSRVDLPWNFELDTALYWVDRVPNQSVADYARLDARLGWRPLPQLELSLVGQNLAQDEHDEFGPSFTAMPTSVPRSFYGKVTWRY